MPSTVATGRIANSGAWGSRAGFATSTALYVLVQDTSDSGLEVWKSLDGASWSQQDAADEPANNSATSPYSGWLHTNGFLYVAYFSAANTLRCRRFDTSNDQWETADVGAANAATSVDQTLPVRAVVRSDGDVIVLFEETTAGRLSHARYEGSSWTTVNTTTVGHWAYDAVIDGDNRAWFAYADNTGNDSTYRSLDNSNVHGTTTDFDATAHTTAKLRSSNAVLFNDGTNNMFAMLGRDSTGELDMYHGTTGAATLGTLTTVGSVTTTTSPQTTAAALAVHNGQIYAVWSTANAVLYDLTTSLTTLTFGTDVTLLSSLTDADPCPQWIVGLSGIGALYQDNGSVKVEWVAGPSSDVGPTVEATATAEVVDNVGTTSLTIAKPAGVASGSLLLAQLSWNGGPGTVTPPSGWDEVFYEDSQTNPKFALYEKLAGGSEPADYAWTWTNTVESGGIVARVDGIVGSGWWDVSPTTAVDATSDATFDHSGVTTTGADRRLIGGQVGNSSSAAVNAPAGYEEHAEIGERRHNLVSAGKSAAGATGTVTFTRPSNVSNKIAWLGALWEGSSGTPGTMTVDAATAPAAGEAVTFDAAAKLTVTEATAPAAAAGNLAAAMAASLVADTATAPAAGGGVALAGQGRLAVAVAAAPAQGEGVTLDAAAKFAAAPATAPAAGGGVTFDAAGTMLLTPATAPAEGGAVALGAGAGASLTVAPAPAAAAADAALTGAVAATLAAGTATADGAADGALSAAAALTVSAAPADAAASADLFVPPTVAEFAGGRVALVVLGGRVAGAAVGGRSAAQLVGGKTP